MKQAEEMLMSILRNIVKEPESIELHQSEETDEKGAVTVINVRVAKDDIGVCIGSKGVTAEAIRRIVGLVGFHNGDQRVYVKIDAPKVPKSHYYPEDIHKA